MRLRLSARRPPSTLRSRGGACSLDLHGAAAGGSGELEPRSLAAEVVAREHALAAEVAGGEERAERNARLHALWERPLGGGEKNHARSLLKHLDRIITQVASKVSSERANERVRTLWQKDEPSRDDRRVLACVDGQGPWCGGLEPAKNDRAQSAAAVKAAYEAELRQLVAPRNATAT